jgi:hypothetical protein
MRSKLAEPHPYGGAMGGPRSTGVLLVTIASIAAGCTDLGPEPGLLQELERNERTWEGARPYAYVYAVERLCYCGWEARGPVRVEVDGTAALGRTYVDTGEAVPQTLADLFPTVDGLFEMLRDAIEAGAEEIRVEYDPVLGAPVDFWIDYQRQVADEEQGMKVTEAIEPTPDLP